MSDHDSKISKGEDIFIENADNSSSETSLEETPAVTKRLLRRIDLFVLPSLCVVYALSLIDRTNVASASVAGLVEDLKLVGSDYSVVTLAFFPTYILAELPSNLIVRKVGTKVYLSFIILAWGLIAMCQGFVKNYPQLVTLRVLLGTFEGGFNPACIYLISAWYKRYETQSRIAIWYMSGSVLSGLNGIISYGLNTMDGEAGIRGWRWIFIIPGAITAALAIPIFITVSEFPEKAKWLSATDRKLVHDRLEHDRGEGERRALVYSDWVETFTDWRVWLISSLLFFVTTGSYALAYFTPTILRGLGFDVALSQILVTPPYIFAAMLSIATGFVSDRVHRRTPFIVGFLSLVIIGFILIGWGPNTGAKLVGIFFGIAGVNCVTPGVLTFLANNVVGTSKRQLSIPLQTIFGGFGGIAGPLLFRAQDAPTYRFGMYGTLMCMALAIIITLILVVHFKSENDKADNGEKILEGRPDFRYTL